MSDQRHLCSYARLRSRGGPALQAPSSPCGGRPLRGVLLGLQTTPRRHGELLALAPLARRAGSSGAVFALRGTTAARRPPRAPDDARRPAEFLALAPLARRAGSSGAAFALRGT